MANLLYVTQGILDKLREHPAYQFWYPVVQNFPKRTIAIEDRSFHGRPLEADEGIIYLTVDMNFVYCRNGMLSFLYEDQDLSYRFTVGDGILRTMDNRQFTALIGAVAKVVSSSDVELINASAVYHPYFDGGEVPPPQPVKAPAKKSSKKSKAKAAPAPKEKAPAKKAPAPTTDYSAELCDEVVAYRRRTKKSFDHLSKRFNIPIEDLKAICKRQRDEADGGSDDDALAGYSADLKEKVYRMKTVSKKSYTYVAERFDLPVETVKLICARH
jgi:hypothetical protein